jgi:hypothetical protein
VSAQRANVSVAVCLMAVSLFGAENPFIGTWKSNAEKSSSRTGAATVNGGILRYELQGDKLKGSVTGVDAQGKPVNFSYEVTLDGKPGAVTGTESIDSISLERLDEHTIKATGKKTGKVVFEDRRLVSDDGKTLTFSRTVMGEQGHKQELTMVFDKQ